MVEPVFSHLRGQQGLNRFRRSGLKAVKREFALHVMAYNLSRAVALLRAVFAAQFIVLNRRPATANNFYQRLRQFIIAFRWSHFTSVFLRKEVVW